MRTIRIWFTKTGEASYISLLDLQRVMGRALKRSGLPVWYTMGFNPHIYMTFTCPLPLGQESLCESVDVKTEQEEPDWEAWKAALTPVMPQGVEVVRVAPAEPKASELGWAAYTVRCHSAAAPAALDAYNKSESAPVQKKSKRGMKTVEMKEHVPAAEYRQEGTDTVFDLRLPASETLNLNPVLLLQYLQETYGLPVVESSILRTALFTKNGEEFC